MFARMFLLAVAVYVSDEFGLNIILLNGTLAAETGCSWMLLQRPKYQSVEISVMHDSVGNTVALL